MIDGIKAAQKEVGRICAKLESNLRVMSVDSSQGCEADVVILGCVRCNEEEKIGFLWDKKRICVALSRAKERLIVIGNSETLRSHDIWRSLYSAPGCKRCMVSEGCYQLDALPGLSSSDAVLNGSSAAAQAVLDQLEVQATGEQGFHIGEETQKPTVLSTTSTVKNRRTRRKLRELVALAKLADTLPEVFTGDCNQKLQGVHTNSKESVCQHTDRLIEFAVTELDDAKWACSPKASMKDSLAVVLSCGADRQKKIAILLVIALSKSNFAYQYSLGVAVVIKPLLRVAASSSNMLAALALSAISQLANNSSINQENLRRSGVNKLLMEKLLSEPRYEVEQATLAIFKMAQHNISVQNDFCQAGAVELLISILHNHSGTSKPKYAIAAIDALVEGRPDVQKACKDLGVIELLLGILRRETINEETLHVVSALGSISKGNPTNQTALRQVNALPLFLQILNCQAAKYLELQRKTVKKLSETTICTMCCVFENNKENQCEFHRLGAVPVLIKLLSNGSPNEKLHAAAAIGLLAKNNTVIQDEAFHCGVVPHITIMVSSKSDLHCKHAVLAIQDLCSGNHKVQNSFQQLGCIKILVQLATTKKEINGIIADALGELAQDNWLNQNLVREEGGIELLFHIGNHSQLLKVLKHNKANQIFLRSKCNPTWIKVVQTEARLAKNHMTDFEALFCPALVEDERSFQKMIDSGHWISKMMSSNYLENEEFQWFQLLVRDLKNLAIPSSQLNKRIYATAAFYQLTFDHRKRQEYLEKTGIIALLVPMLSDTDSKLKTLAACTVSNLCFLRCSTYTIFKNQMLLMGALAIPPLLASIKSPRNVWCVRESAVAAVLNMAANNNQIQDLLTKQGALDLFISMLSSDVKRMARCGAAAVWILSEKNEATSALLNKMGAPKILFNLASNVMCGLEDQDLEVADLVVYASLAMSSLADAYVPCCEQLIGYGVLDMFCSILKHKNCSYRIRVIVSGTLKSFITGVDTGGLSDGVTNRLIKTLVALLSSIHMECRLHGALTLTSLLEFKGGLLKTAILEARVLPLIISTIRVDVGGYAAEAAARVLSLLVHDNSSGQEEVRTLGGVELLMIAAKQNLPAVDDNKPKSKLPFAAAEALESLCHHNDANTQAVKDGQEKEWRNLIDRVFTKPPDPKDKKNTAYSNARYHLRVLEDCSGNGASMSVLNDSSKEREPINNNTVHNGNGNSKGPCTQLAVESQNCYKKHTKQTLGVPQGPAQVLLFRAAASPGIYRPRVRQDTSRNRFEGLEVETDDLEKETKAELLKMQRALTKRLSEIRALALQDLLGGELDSQQREKVSKEASTASLLERVEEELQARSD